MPPTTIEDLLLEWLAVEEESQACHDRWTARGVEYADTPEWRAEWTPLRQKAWAITDRMTAAAVNLRASRTNAPPPCIECGGSRTVEHPTPKGVKYPCPSCTPAPEAVAAERVA